MIKDVKNGNFATYPGLTAKLIAAHLPKSEVIIFGNLDQTQKKLRSKNSEQLALETETDFTLLREDNKNYLFTAVGLADSDNRKV